MRKAVVIFVAIVIAAAALAQEKAKEDEIRELIKERKISIVMMDASLVFVIQHFARLAGVNIVIDPSVDRELTVTLHLQDVSLKTALETALWPNDLDYLIKEGAVIYVATKKRIAELRGEMEKGEHADLEAGQLLLLLKDGSKLKGRVALEKWKLKTAYGELTIPANEIRRIRFPREAKEGEKALKEDEVETIRFTVTGKLEIEKLEVDTGKGKLTIPKSDIKEILFPGTVEKMGKIKVATKAEVAACAANLRQIFVACVLYEQDNRIFPFAGEDAKAHEHLQLLVDGGYVEDPKLFISPASGKEKPAPVDEDGHFKLSEETCSYAYASVLRNSSSRASKRIIANKRLIDMQGVKGLNILYVGGNVEWVKAESKSWEDLTKGLLAK